MFVQRGRFYSETMWLPKAGAFLIGVRCQRGPGLPFRITFGLGVVALTVGLLARRAPEGVLEALSYIPFKKAS